MISVVHSTPVWLPQTHTWLYNQVRYLPADIAAHVACEYVENLDQFGLANIHALASRPAWQRFWDRRLRKLGIRRHLSFTVDTARRCGAKILHSHFGHVGWADIGAARHAKIRHVVTFYGLDVNYVPGLDPHWPARYRTMFAQVDAVLCEGPHMAAAVAALGCPAAKIHVHHLGVALDDVPFRPFPWRPGDRLRVLIAASFRQKKGIPYALEALARLQRHVPLEVTVIGDAGQDPRAADEKREILASVDRLGLEPSTTLLGYQPHARLLAEAERHHVFLAPSITADDGDTEGGAPVSLIEMAASGLVVVSTTHCDIPGIVKHRETGLLAPERDVQGLVDNLDWLIDHIDCWEPMRIAARKHVEREFNAARQGERLAELYRSLAP